MTAAYRLKGLGWFASGVVVALGFYLVSLQVSVERKRLESVDRSIVEAQADIRSLQTEFSTRANLAQLERWNGDVLSLTAPNADQYIGSQAQLAALDPRALPGDGSVQTAALVIPSAIDPAAAGAPPPATEGGHAVPATKPVQTAPAVQVAATRSTPAAPMAKPAAAPVRVASVTHGSKAEAVAMLDRKLLSDATLGDLASGARAERGSMR